MTTADRKPPCSSRRPGRHWPRTRPTVLDDRLLGPAWLWDLDDPEDDGPPRTQRLPRGLEVA